MSQQGPSVLEAMLDDFIRHLRRVGLVTDARFERVDYDLSFQLNVRLRSGETRSFRMRDDELRMDERALRHWIEVIDRDIWERAGRYRGPGWAQEDEARQWAMQQLMTASPPQLDPGMLLGQLGQFTGSAGQAQQLNAMQGLAQQRAAMDMAARDQAYQQLAVLASMGTIGFPARNPEADKKAEKLFIESAGKEAFDTLSAGKPLKITGSNGTAYTLHKRASYCVERTSDGAKMCAVVPGVPLWDHLLGIKLMVERDEDKFLRTANVSQGVTRTSNPYGRANWVSSIIGWDARI